MAILSRSGNDTFQEVPRRPHRSSGRRARMCRRGPGAEAESESPPGRWEEEAERRAEGDSLAEVSFWPARFEVIRPLRRPGGFAWHEQCIDGISRLLNLL